MLTWLIWVEYVRCIAELGKWSEVKSKLKAIAKFSLSIEKALGSGLRTLGRKICGHCS